MRLGEHGVPMSSALRRLPVGVAMRTHAVEGLVSNVVTPSRMREGVKQSVCQFVCQFVQ